MVVFRTQMLNTPGKLVKARNERLGSITCGFLEANVSVGVRDFGGQLGTVLGMCSIYLSPSVQSHVVAGVSTSRSFHCM